MNNHIDLYVEHYMDLHNYINDKICNIGYSSELLLEEGKWYDNIVHVLKKMWEAVLKWFNTSFKSMANSFLPNEIRSKANSLFNQREKLFQEYKQKSIESIIQSYEGKDSTNYFDQFLEKANNLINNPNNKDAIKSMNNDIIVLNRDYAVTKDLYSNLENKQKKYMESYYECLLYKLCNVDKFVNPYLQLNIILDRILFDIMFGIQIIDECFKDINDLYLNGEEKNAELITKIQNEFKINDIYDELFVKKNFKLNDSDYTLYEYYLYLTVRINAIKMIPLRSLNIHVPDDYNFGKLLNDEEINTNTNYTIFETLNKHIHIKNLPMLKHLAEKINSLAQVYKVNGQISLDTTKLEQNSDEFIKKRNANMDNMISFLKDKDFTTNFLGQKNIKLGNELNKISLNLIKLLQGIQQQYTLSKQIDSFFLFRIDHRI